MSRGRIPLGHFPADPSRIVYKIYPMMSDSMIIAAAPGRGKSVIARLVYACIAERRPIIVIDWEGEDHRFSAYANSQPVNLPPMMGPAPVRKSLFFNYSRNRMKHERLVIPSLTAYNSSELRCLGIPAGGCMKLQALLRKYGDQFENMEDLIDCVQRFPTNDSQIAQAKKRFKNRKCRWDYGNSSMPGSTKQSLDKYLNDMLLQEVFTVNRGSIPDYVRLLDQGYNLFLSFGGLKDVARAETARILNLVIDYCKKNSRGKVPYFWFEELDALCPRFFDDMEEKKKSEYATYTLAEAYRRARKQGIGLGGLCPNPINLHKTIMDLSEEKVFGQLSGENLQEVLRCTSPFVKNIVRGLRFNKYTQYREFVYYNSLRQVFKFIPYECPQEIHRERKVRGVA